MVKGFLLSKVVPRLFACAVAAGVLGWVVVHCGPREGTVVLHVLEPGLEVTLAGRVYSFQEPIAGPLVLHLPPGRYHFRVRRGDAVVHAESFTLRGGDSQVLAAIRD